MSEHKVREDKPIFIVGVGRSGTTLIRLMLHSHPRIAIPYESHFISDYYSRIDQYGDLNKNANLKSLVQDILDEELVQQWDHEFNLSAILESVDQPTLGAIIRALYSQYCASKGKVRWGDKSDYLTKLDVINEIFPDAQFIHCIRDGRDVANSVIKLPWGPRDVIQAAEWWASSVRLGRSMGRMLPKGRYMEVRYEDLVTDPERELRGICTFLGEDYSDSMLGYHEEAAQAIPKARKGQHQNVGSPPTTSRVEAWTREMSQIDIALFDRYASTQLAASGYQTGTSTVGNLSMEARRAWIMLSRLLKAYLSKMPKS